MTQENVEGLRGVRTQIAVSSVTKQRTLDERILVRFPGIARSLAAGWSRLPPRSRLRRAVLSRIVRQGTSAWNRRDFDLVFLLMDSEAEFQLPESLIGGYVPPDLRGVHRGREGYLRYWQGMFEAWADLKSEPEEAIDFGDRLLVTSRITGRGKQSGIPVDQRLFQVITLRRGLVVEQNEFADRGQALEAAGLSA
jgi:ketosteroid isomerase-like protein